MGQLDYLDRYIFEAEAHANELFEYFEHETRVRIAEFFRENWAEYHLQLEYPPQAAFVFLGQNPSEQAKKLEKLEAVESALLWMQARRLALLSAIELRRAKDAVDVKGWGYRKAVRHVAQVASRPRVPLSPWDIAMLELPC